VIVEVAIAPGDARLAYVAQEDEANVLVLDGERQAWRAPSAVGWSADGAHVAWRAETEQGPVVVVDGVASRPLPGLSSTLRFATGGTQLVVGALRGRECWREVLPVPLTLEPEAESGR
jgi:hypothetical protein